MNDNKKKYRSSKIVRTNHSVETVEAELQEYYDSMFG